MGLNIDIPPNYYYCVDAYILWTISNVLFQFIIHIIINYNQPSANNIYSIINDLIPSFVLQHMQCANVDAHYPYTVVKMNNHFTTVFFIVSINIQFILWRL